MDDPLSQTHVPIGFVSVRERSPHGYFGGYLLVNELARPLEFHCTLPLQPTRAQQILFGTTLDEFLCGEQIARALLSRSKIQPALVLTDCPAALAVRHWLEIPIFLLEPHSEDLDSTNLLDSANLEERESQPIHNDFRIPRWRRPASQYASRRLGNHALQWLSAYPNDARALDGLDTPGDSRIDLKEPFARIIDALAEAHPKTKAA